MEESGTKSTDAIVGNTESAEGGAGNAGTGGADAVGTAAGGEAESASQSAVGKDASGLVEPNEGEVLKADAIAQYKFVWNTLPGDAETKAMTLNRAKALGATEEDLAL